MTSPANDSSPSLPPEKDLSDFEKEAKAAAQKQQDTLNDDVDHSDEHDLDDAHKAEEGAQHPEPKITMTSPSPDVVIATVENSIPESAEAEAIAQLFENDKLIESIDIERITFELTETDAVSEFALSNPRFAISEPVPTDPFEEGPAPRKTFLVLDRPKVSSADELSLDNVPNVDAEILTVIRLTNNEARRTSRDEAVRTACQ